MYVLQMSRVILNGTLIKAQGSRAGRKGSYAHYYLQVAAPNHGKSFIGEWVPVRIRLLQN